MAPSRSRSLVHSWIGRKAAIRFRAPQRSGNADNTVAAKGTSARTTFVVFELPASSQSSKSRCCLIRSTNPRISQLRPGIILRPSPLFGESHKSASQIINEGFQASAGVVQVHLRHRIDGEFDSAESGRTTTFTNCIRQEPLVVVPFALLSPDHRTMTNHLAKRIGIGQVPALDMRIRTTDNEPVPELGLGRVPDLPPPIGSCAVAVDDDDNKIGAGIGQHAFLEHHLVRAELLHGAGMATESRAHLHTQPDRHFPGNSLDQCDHELFMRMILVEEIRNQPITH